MEWRGRRGSRNVEDRRGMGVGGAGGLGVVGTIVVLAVGYFFGVDITPVVQQTQSMQPGEERELSQAEQEVGQFVSVVLADAKSVTG